MTSSLLVRPSVISFVAGWIIRLDAAVQESKTEGGLIPFLSGRFWLFVRPSLSFVICVASFQQED